MKERVVFDTQGHAHFVTFSCYKRRRLLDHEKARRIVVSQLQSRLAAQNGRCIGFVVMPDHVHALVWFAEDDQLSRFMKHWKRLSSVMLKRLYRDELTAYGRELNLAQPIWQPRYYSFNIFSSTKLLEKLEYMHNNPVRAGLVSSACAWPHSSARFYEEGKPVGVALGHVQ